MKLKATKKEMREGYYRIIGIGYCDAQHLLKYVSPFAYSSGINGWCCDYYDIDDVLISTGYSHLDNKNTKVSYKLIREYDNKAIDANSEERSKLLKEFVDRCMDI